ncbi:tetratricopeptide repeat protein [Pseudoduganella rhizocola]|uniref:tetratricopeptide repeat protein n=1 Tax=Pseudoduganella rhizocola TaxID=3382643 RepID=UPI0038B53B69
MKRIVAGVLLVVLAGLAGADELADGVKAWEAQDFSRAHQIFSKLAAAGNAEAQLLLGEMYGFGEGVPEDPAQAASWLNKAKAGGHPDAAASLATLQQRGVRKADIAYYANGGYQAENLRLDKYACVKPVFPDASRTQPEIRKTQAEMTAWSACYQRFTQGLANVMPAGKAIPADVAQLMSLSELAKARASMDKVYAAIAAAGEAEGRAVLAANDAWAARTKESVETMAKKTTDEQYARARERDRLSERYRQALENAQTGR